MSNEVIKFSCPDKIRAGNEVVWPTLKIGSLKDKRRITFHWDDDTVKVIGAHMISPNVFEFEPSNDQKIWYLKWTVSQKAKQCTKSAYITIEKITSNNIMIWLSRILATTLFIIPLVLYILSAASFNPINKIITVEVSFIGYTLSIPLLLILLILSWSSKATEFIKRLFAIKTTEKLNYSQKGISGGLKIMPGETKGDTNNMEDNYYEIVKTSDEVSWKEVF